MACLVLVAFFLVSPHLAVGFKILSVYATWHLRSDIRLDGLRFRRDGFDQSFAIYPQNQVSAAEPSYLDLGLSSTAEAGNEALLQQRNDDLVPPILHHILIGMDWTTAPETWHNARNNCLAFHPTYEVHFWDDHKATEFLKREYPWFADTWLNYPYVIQRADSLRYFVLHHYGGVFMDLDLSCRRSLAPLRRFPAAAIAANPVGVSNGFMMASPRHPLFEQLIQALPRYNLNWGHSYITVMWTTGPMFLSTEMMYFKGETAERLRVLDRRYHRLSGAVSTPLFDHLGASSWHQSDTIFLKQAVRQLSGHAALLLALASCAVAGVGLRFWLQRRRLRQAKSDAPLMVAILFSAGAQEFDGLLDSSSDREHSDYLDV